MSTKKSGWSKKVIWGIVAVAVISAFGWYSGMADGLLGGGAGDADREGIYKAAITQAEGQATGWPKTEDELLRQFWKCIATGDIKQVTVYCPGSKEGDYVAYSHMKPKEQIQVGTPAPHPTAKGVMLWPVRSSFARYGDKTIKLAVARLQSGQLVIDGQHSIWW